jgi:hypothetical protein
MSLPPSYLRGAPCFLALLLSANLSACSTGDDMAELLRPPHSHQASQAVEPPQQMDMWSQGERMTQTGDSLVMEGRDLIAEGEARIAQGQRITEEGKRIQATASGGQTGHDLARTN